MTETVLVKRRARYVGEIGFFPAAEMFSEDVALFPMNEETLHIIKSERRLQDLKYLWALVHKVAENTDRYVDKDEAMHDLKLRAAFTKVVYDDKTKQLEIRPKSLTRISGEKLRQLTATIEDIVLRDLMPGMKRNQLRHEIEEMIGVTKTA